MPDFRQWLEDGLRYERSGASSRAMECYVGVASGTSEPHLKAEALRRQADIHRTLCAWDAAIEAAKAAYQVAEDAGLPDLAVEALNAEAAVYNSRGEHAAATRLYERMLKITSDERIRGIALQNLGAMAAAADDFETAERRFTASFQCFRQAGYARGEAIARNNFAALAIDQGMYELASAVSELALQTALQVGDLELVSITRLNLAESLIGTGQDPRRAEQLATSSLGYFTTQGNVLRQIACLRVVGDLARNTDAPADARRSYVRGLELAQQVGAGGEIQRLERRLGELGGAATQPA